MRPNPSSANFTFDEFDTKNKEATEEASQDYLRLPDVEW